MSSPIIGGHNQKKFKDNENAFII